MTDYPTPDLDAMTASQMRALIKDRYLAAVADETFTKLAAIARELGKQQGGDPKYIYQGGDIEIYLDEYGNYMTVKVGKKEVASTHQTNQFIIPGEWLDAVRDFYDEAVERKGARLNKRDNNERNELLDKLR